MICDVTDDFLMIPSISREKTTELSKLTNDWLQNKKQYLGKNVADSVGL